MMKMDQRLRSDIVSHRLRILAAVLREGKKRGDIMPRKFIARQRNYVEKRDRPEPLNLTRAGG
jgi:hypothetical protein